MGMAEIVFFPVQFECNAHGIYGFYGHNRHLLCIRIVLIGNSFIALAQSAFQILSKVDIRTYAKPYFFYGLGVSPDFRKTAFFLSASLIIRLFCFVASGPNLSVPG